MDDRRLDTIEDLVGHRFDDRRLLADAVSTSARGFGPLETLGDAIADFAVSLTCWRHGLDDAEAAHRVSNAVLDEIFERHLRGLVDAVSGDVVESLVGAVHLDGGFDAAARLAVRWCCADLDWEPLGDVDVDEWVTVDDLELPAGLASTALDALVTDVIVRRLGLRVATQRDIHRLRVRVVDGPGRRRLAGRLGFRSSSSNRRGIAEPVRAGVLTTLLTAGWDRTRALLEPEVRIERVRRRR
ncbi:MAG: ribonuclease III domain-containing protein [Ilumatobacteraceae bacterium]